VKHLLVTNDFPPKHGGIQSYLWELWRRLPAGDVTVLTTPHPGDSVWDGAQPFRVVRARQRVLLPTPALRRRIDALAEEVGAELVVLDPALPLGALGPRLARPYGLVLHGAEVTVPGRLPAAAPLLRRVLRGASVVVAAGSYPLDEARRCARRPLAGELVVPPGVDVERFRPLDDDERASARRRHGLPEDAVVVLGVSRLVPRKGFDVLLRAAAGLDVVVAVAGGGRDEARLRRMAPPNARLLGRVADDELPALYGAADVFAMLCRNRWGGLEQEGFGIVFLEAAAAGLPQVAGRSGGSWEAVADGETGFVLDDPTDLGAVTGALQRLVADADLRRRMGAAARARAVAGFTYDDLAASLSAALS
jgi:phosphatidylinositol alpha-1,6-mannosyltransferase